MKDERRENRTAEQHAPPDHPEVYKLREFLKITKKIYKLAASLPDEESGASGLSNRHANLQQLNQLLLHLGITYERTVELSAKIRDIYYQVNVDNKTYLMVTQGVNEVTVIAEPRVAELFRNHLKDAHVIYDKQDLVGITVKFTVGNLEIPNLIYALTRRLAYKDINIIEVVSTATELTYMIEKKDLAAALEQLQKDI